MILSRRIERVIINPSDLNSPWFCNVWLSQADKIMQSKHPFNQRRFNLESERYGRLLQMNKIRSTIELIIYEVAHAFTELRSTVLYSLVPVSSNN